MDNDYYVIFSSKSSSSYGGRRPQVSWMTGRFIVDLARRECERVGESIESLAGIAWVEQGDHYVPERELSERELFDLAVEKLGDDGRLFIVCDTQEEFLERARDFNLSEDAKKLIA